MKHFLTADQLPGVFIDALLTDDDDQLVFLSAWGSEAYIQQNRAAFTLAHTSSAIDRLHCKLATPPEKDDVFYPRFAFLNDKKHLTDSVGRPAGHTVFAHLTHWQAYDRLAINVDHVRQASLLLRAPHTDQTAWEVRLWQAIQNLSTTPLHPAWEKTVLSVFQEKQWVTHLQGFGIDACRIHLPPQDVERTIQEAVKAGDLTLPALH